MYLIAVRGATSNEDNRTLAAVTHVWEDGVRDIYHADKIRLHHLHHSLGSVNHSTSPACDRSRQGYSVLTRSPR